MRQTLAWMSVLAAAACCRCASRGNVEMLESQLRRQEDQIYALRRDLKSAQSELAAVKREAVALRERAKEQTVSTDTPEQVQALHRVESVQISRFLTGGLDRDGQPGDDHFSAFVTPLDGHGELVKAPGAFRLEVLDMARDGADRQAGTWEFTALEAEELWHKGIFGSGYTFRLPWKNAPRSDKLTLHVRMTTPDGRQFDANREFLIAVPGSEGIAAKNRRRPAVATKPARPRISQGRPGPSGTSTPASDVPPPQDSAPMPPPFPELKPVPPASKFDSSAVEPRSLPLSDEEAPGKVRLVSATESDDPFELPKLERKPRRMKPADPDALAPLPRSTLRPVTRNDEGRLDPAIEGPPRRSIPTSDRFTELDRPVIR